MNKRFGLFSVMTALLLPLVVYAAGVPVTTLSGQPSSLGEQLERGKWNVVMLWTTYCGVCREQYPAISEFHRRHADTDAVVLGISLDGPNKAAKVASYRQAQSHAFPSVITTVDHFRDMYEKATGESFTGTPTYLVIDKQGGLRAFLGGPTSLEQLEQVIAQ